jgi:outer membrane protein assembly factor BamB
MLCVPNRTAIFYALALVGLWAASAGAESRWPRWRDPRGDGHSAEAGLPVTWNQSAVAWRAALGAEGESSPILWDDKIFLTATRDGGRQRLLVCLDRAHGGVLWQKEIDYAGEPEPLHKMNSFASATCATDGDVLVAFFGRAGLHAFTLDGTPLWSKRLGKFESPWGPAASPVIVGDLVVQNGDADSDAFLAAYDKRTGDEVWNVPRPNYRGWSTPIVIEAEGRRELVLNGHEGVAAYDPLSGKQLWFCRAFAGRGEPTVTPGGGLLYLVCGLAGDVYAVRPGGDGDVTATRMAWHTPRRVRRDLPSPIAVGDYLLVVSMDGIAVCYDGPTGEVLWQQRLGGNYSASPIAAAGNAYFTAEDGSISVIEPGPKFKLVARNVIEPEDDEVFRASPAAADGRLYLRSDRAVYCIAADVAQSVPQ